MGFENVNFQEVVGYTINLMALRTDKPPFDDVNIRKAVSYATPLQAIMEKIVGVTGIQSRNTTVPPNMPGSASEELEPMPYDLDKAKELMAASSMPDGFSTKLNVIAPNDIWVPQAIAIQEALKELNIDVEIVQYAYADFISLQQAGDYEGIMNFQWGSDFPDAAGKLASAVPVDQRAAAEQPLLLQQSRGRSTPQRVRIGARSGSSSQDAHGGATTHLGRPARDLPRALQVVHADVGDAHWLHLVATLVLGLVWPRSRASEARAAAQH